MLTNVIIFIPKLLIEYRFDGAIMSIIFAIVIGIALVYIDTKVFGRFLGKGLPEIIENKLKKPYKVILFLGLSIFWYSAGLLTLLGFIDILHRFINPELSKVWLFVLFFSVICFVIQLPTHKVMYLLEIILIINVPFIGFIFLKAISSDYLSWNSIFEVGTHLFSAPKLIPIAVATYAFSGYTNIIVFNRLFKEKIKNINFLFVLILSILNLITTFFIPIGIHGADGVNEYIYPWMMTSDSLRIIYGPIERALFIFLMLYISITLLSVSVHWHVALELIKGSYAQNPSKKKNWFVLLSFFGSAILVVFYNDKISPEWIVMYSLLIRFFVEIICVLMFFFFLRRRK
jgi:spore germination protein KB